MARPATANNPNVNFETGPLANRPLAAKAPGGSFYFASDTNQLFALIRDPAGVFSPAWDEVITAATAAPSGAGFKAPVLAATTIALPAYTVSADKQTLTANANGAFPTVDGVAVPVGASFLLDTGAADADNGIYVLTAAGGAGAPFVATRRADANTAGSITQGTRIAIQQGATYAGQVFVQQTAGPIVIGTTPQGWWASATPQFYVNPATGSDANSGSVSAPFASFTKAWTSVLPMQVATINLPAAQTTPYAPPTGSFVVPQGATIYIVGVYGSQLGSRTAAAGSTTTVVNDTAGGLTINASRGDLLVWDATTPTVALRGAHGTIRSNAAGSFTLFDAQPAVPSAADTFTVQRTTSKLQWTQRSQLDVTGGFVFSDAVEWQSNAPSIPTALFRLVGPGVFRARGSRFTDVGAGSSNLNIFDRIAVCFGTFAAQTSAQGLTASGAFAPPGQWDHGCFFSKTNTFVSMAGNSLGYVQNAVINGNASAAGISVGEGSRLAIAGLDLIGGTIGAGSPGTYFLINGTLSGGTGNTISGANSGEPGTVWFDQGARGQLNNTDISNTSLPAVMVRRTAYAELGNNGVITGTGNTGAGVQVDEGGRAHMFSTNSVTGTLGDLSIDGVIRTWAAAGPYVVSGLNQPGVQVTFAGGLTGGAGATTVYIPVGGGVPSAANGTGNSPTAMRYPMAIGSVTRNLRMTILTNALTTATVFTEMKAPLATGTPAATTITISVAATTTGSFADTTHTAVFQDGDQFDLQAANTAGGANPLTMTASLQIS